MTTLLPAVFTPQIHWCPELDCYVARCPGLFFGALHGPDPESLLSELVDAIQAALGFDAGASHQNPLQPL